MHSAAVVATALVLLAAAGCSSPVRGNVGAASIPRAEPPHVAAAEATASNAGAKHCDLRAPVDIGAALKSEDFVIGFGDRGGLLAWSTAGGIRVRPFSAAGEPTGAETVFAVPRDAKPVEIAPLGAGFVVVAKRIEYRTSVCEGRCVDATCSGWPRDVPQPHVCQYSCPKPCQAPSAHEFVIQYMNLAGQMMGAPIIFQTGLVDVEAVLLGHGMWLGLVTGSQLLWIHVVERGSIVLFSRDPLQTQYALPVRGPGSPTLLAIDEDGSARVIDLRGEHALKGSLIDARSGRIVDARLQARWDSNGRIHVARQAWLESLDSIHYAVIENHEVHADGELGRRGFREPFAEYVEPHLEDGRFRRSSWLRRAVGEDIDLRRKDPTADANRARFAWTGKSFLFAYPALGNGGEILRTMIADCSGAVLNGSAD